MLSVSVAGGAFDHCRIGSLENYLAVTGADKWDHCRIGSLEIFSNLRNVC